MKRRVRRLTLWASFALLCGFGAYSYILFLTLTLPHSNEHQPLMIYGAPFWLEAGLDLGASRLSARLEHLGYRRVPGDVQQPGEFRLTPAQLDIYLQDDPDRQTAAFPVRLIIEEKRVTRIVGLPDGKEIPSVPLEPPLIGGRLESSRRVREWMPLASIPSHVIDAVLAIEDRRFYRHPGIDPRAMIRAALTNLRSGQVMQGGSTITQQLAKNLYFSPQRTVTRKLRETAAALALEMKYGKDEILESYLNEIYFGQQGSVAVHGVGEAARRYFGKRLQELTIPEAALLAGMIRAPNLYSPLKAPLQAKERRDLVLFRLREDGKLSEQEFREAVATPVRVAPGQDAPTDAPYFVDYLLREVETSSGQDLRPGQKLMSTLDLEIQRVAEKVLRLGLEKLEARYPLLKRAGHALQGALVVLDPKTGGIVAMVGGRDYRTSQFNRAVQARRQPGSLIKPFVYTAAFESSLLSIEGAITPASLVEDAPISFETSGGTWEPQNYDRRFRGEVTIRTALEQSLNVPAVRVAQTIGIRQFIDLLRELGLPKPQDDNLSVALGTSEVSLLEVTAAFGALARSGLFLSPTGLRAVVEPTGERVAKHAEEGRQVVSPQTAYLVTSLLEGVMERGTAAQAAALGLKNRIAGKTGTTDEYRDAWFVGYTPALVIGVWVGFDDRRELRLTGAQAALPIWMEMARHLIPTDSPEFEKPTGIVTESIDPQSGQLTTSECPEVVEEVFIQGTEPTEYCPLHGGGLLDRLKRGLGLL
jgi:penicillin-binding protein 1B